MPRTYRAEPVLTRAPRPPLRRRRVLLLVGLVAAAVMLGKHFGSTASVPADFQPGQKEASEYQAAMDEEQTSPEAEVAADNAMVTVDAAAPVVAEVHDVAGVAKVQAVSKPEKMAREESKFGFYDSLPRSAWSVPVQRGIYVTEEDRKRANQRYMLQAASVRDVDDARRLVQKLRGVGLVATYSNADDSGGWYRVNVGPFDNVSKMNKAEDILVSLRMMPLKRKIP